MYFIFKQFREENVRGEFETPNLYQLAGNTNSLVECNDLLAAQQESIANKLLVIKGDKRSMALTLLPEPKKKGK